VVRAWDMHIMSWATKHCFSIFTFTQENCERVSEWVLSDMNWLLPNNADNTMEAWRAFFLLLEVNFFSLLLPIFFHMAFSHSHASNGIKAKSYAAHCKIFSFFKLGCSFQTKIFTVHIFYFSLFNYLHMSKFPSFCHFLHFQTPFGLHFCSLLTLLYMLSIHSPPPTIFTFDFFTFIITHS